MPSSLYRRQVAHGKTVARKRDVTLIDLNIEPGPRYFSIPYLEKGNLCTEKQFNEHICAI